MPRFGVGLTYFVYARLRQITFLKRETVKFHAFFIVKMKD